jgi:hypothetical protein
MNRYCQSSEPVGRAACAARALSVTAAREVRIPHIGSLFILLALLLAGASPLGAQVFVEGGGGWTYVQPSASRGGYNLRAAIGRAVTPRVRVRVDAFMIQFNDKIPVCAYQPSDSLDCSYTQDQALFDGKVSGVAATGLLDIDRRGILYVLGGVTHVFANERNLGVTAGAGLTAPAGVRARVFAEARWMTFSTRYLAPRAVQLTFGFRYGK